SPLTRLTIARANNKNPPRRRTFSGSARFAFPILRVGVRADEPQLQSMPLSEAKGAEVALPSPRTAAGSADPRGWGLRLVLPRERRRAADRQSQICATRAYVQGPPHPPPLPRQGARGE